ncbi:DUF502 domain-containing protein [soil metagenome]
MKRYFITGLLVLVPLGITLWVLHFVVATMDQVLQLFPAEWRANSIVLNVPGTGVVLTLAFILLVGLLTQNIIGRRLVLIWENLLNRIPIVRSIYSSVKQVSDTVLKPNGQAFRKAVLVEFPRAGSWTVGFVVGTPGAEIESRLGALGALGLAEAPQTVFVPTAPNPTSGYIVILAPDQIQELDMSVDEALKFIISLGVVKPGTPVEAAAPAAA